MTSIAAIQPTSNIVRFVALGLVVNMKNAKSNNPQMTAAELYILNCKKWRESHPRKRRLRSFYQAIGCKIYIGF